ncbi:MAG: glycoside hydrolase family 27 protein, partial [Gemmatimonadaceae bacterium]
LRDGSKAVVLFNRASVPSRITANWGRIGIRTRQATVRDLWAHKDLGVVENRYTADVPSHGVVMLRVTPAGE